jgi:hypothetical protein
MDPRLSKLAFRCLKMLHNTSENFKWIQHSQNLLFNASKCFKILQKISNGPEILKTCFSMLKNASKYFRKFQMDPRLSKFAFRCLKMLQNTSKKPSKTHHPSPPKTPTLCTQIKTMIRLRNKKIIIHKMAK